MTKIILKIETIDGQKKLSVKGGKKLSEILEALSAGIYDITIEKHASERSIYQNAFYWGVLIPEMQEFFNSFSRLAPMTNNQAHVQFKDIVGFYEDVQIYSKESDIYVERRIYKSLSNAGDLTAKEFGDAWDICREAIRLKSNGVVILSEPDFTKGRRYKNNKVALNEKETK